MNILYFVLSLISTVGIVLGCGAIDLFIGRDEIYKAFELIGKINVYNLLHFDKIFLIISLAFLCSFVIIILLYVKNGKRYIFSSLLASGISILFFTLYFRSFDIVKNFYVVSKEFSQIIKSTFNTISVFNIVLSSLLIFINVIYLICIIIRRKKNEKEF